MKRMNLESGRMDRNKCKKINNFIKQHLFQKRSIFKTLILCMSFLILLSGTSFAVADLSDEKDTNSSKSNHSFEISAVTNYFDYSEPDVDIDITGFMAGVNGKYTYCAPAGFIFSAELEYTYGLNTEYDGQTQSGTPLPIEDSEDWIVEARLLTGGRLNINKNSIINPYLGVGYRYWNNDIDGSGFYKRKTEYLYLPIGTSFIHKVSENFKWGLTLEFDIFLWGQNRSYLSDADPGFNNVKLEQDSGYGLRACLPFTYKSLQIEPYIYYWNIDDSDLESLTYYGMPTGYAVYEPENETTVCGIRLTYLF